MTAVLLCCIFVVLVAAALLAWRRHLEASRRAWQASFPAPDAELADSFHAFVRDQRRR